jgi:hypothetical protein
MEDGSPTAIKDLPERWPWVEKGPSNRPALTVKTRANIFDFEGYNPARCHGKLFNSALL